MCYMYMRYKYTISASELSHQHMIIDKRTQSTIAMKMMYCFLEYTFDTRYVLYCQTTELI